MRAYLNIGTNVGNRLENIDTAVALIHEHVGTVVCRTDVVTTVPWGFESSNLFFNIAVAVDTDFDPLALLGELKEIERTMGSAKHRNDSGEYVDRIIDIDIMAIDGITVDTDTLTVPHKHLYDRPFFLMLYLTLKGF